MAIYKATLIVDSTRVYKKTTNMKKVKGAVEEAVERMFVEHSLPVEVRSIEKVSTKKQSRQARMQTAIDKIQEGMDEATTLRDELQEWFDNLPEQFQEGTKGEQLGEAIEQIEDCMAGIEDGMEAANTVEFPRMFGS
jgi:soluble cytochrome b562